MTLAQASPVVVHFGVFEADLRAGELRRNGVKVRIQDLPFRALALLLSRPHEVVTREELRQALWPDGVFVDFDRSISTAIKRLRDALGDSADNPIFVETIERRGYRWIGPVQGPELSVEAVVQPGLQIVAPPLPHASPRWKFIFVLPVLALLFAAWIFRPSYRSAKAGSKTQRTSSASSAGLPHHAANRDAEEFYLQGRYYWEKRTPDSLNKAVDSFTQAIVHDPGYAPAYVGLADCYNLLREYTVMPAAEAYPRALAAAKKAVELDPQSSEAHASLAFASFFGMWDAATADREFRRAIDLNPNNAIAHHWYATYLECLRRYPESLAEIERAQALEPAAKSVLADKGAILFDAGRLPEAIALLKHMEENEPDFISPHRYLKFIYLQTEDYPRYLVEARSEAVLMHDNSALAVVEATEKGFATGGGKDLLKTLLQQQTKLYQRGQLSPYFLAVTCSLQGNKQEALRYLRTAYDQRADGLFQIETDHAFDNLHNEPAFRQLVADVGLPPLSEENSR
ncbi:MAG: winged helix-turn-helix domain-containing protein [Acidobacteriia bacterium]|nr:winged helix-turn-helix domain-containing protein [Terriglobia bacterium]